MRMFAVLFTTVAVPCLIAAAPMPTEEVQTLMVAVRAHERWPEPGRAAFEAGASAWTAGRYLAARNHWTRAEAWLRRARPADAACEALGRLTAEADRLSRPVVEPAPLSAKPKPGPVRRVRRVEAAPPVADARSVMKKARAARDAGEIEKAVRLMKIASMLPGGEDAGAQAAAWEGELDRRGDLVQPAR